MCGTAKLCDFKFEQQLYILPQIPKKLFKLYQNEHPYVTLQNFYKVFEKLTIIVRKLASLLKIY